MKRNYSLKKILKSVVLIQTATLLASASVYALPFNDDMVQTQIMRPGSIVRAKPEHSVSVGSLSFYVENEAQTQNWQNPNSQDPLSTSRGKRLYEINCQSCHGIYKNGKNELGEVGKKSIAPPPDLTHSMYQSRTDGFFYGTIHFGGAALMPGLGFKLSPEEKWDIVSYIRKIQVEGRK